MISNRMKPVSSRWQGANETNSHVLKAKTVCYVGQRRSSAL